MEEVQQSSSQMKKKMMKGKRTKRQRPMSPFNTTPLTATYSSSSSACGDENGNSFTSASYESTEEDEDMANCLILLAQGGAETSASPPPKDQTSPVHQVSGHVSKSGFFVYECKTCNRTFPPFQALGGHRASHKKPKTADQHDKKPTRETTLLTDLITTNSTSLVDQQVEDSKQHVKDTSPPPPTQAKSTSISTKGFQISNKVKIHECSICGSEFSSGQALGGHMRRHRAIVDKSNISTTTTSQMLLSVVDNNQQQQQQKERSNILALDLNLPAPEDHDHHHQHDSKFQFMPTQETRYVFNAAPALVDCHY